MYLQKLDSLHSIDMPSSPNTRKRSSSGSKKKTSSGSRKRNAHSLKKKYNVGDTVRILDFPRGETTGRVLEVHDWSLVVHIKGRKPREDIPFMYILGKEDTRNSSSSESRKSSSPVAKKESSPKPSSGYKAGDIVEINHPTRGLKRAVVNTVLIEGLEVDIRGGPSDIYVPYMYVIGKV